jgi:tetratricopeptide (TPR) repeat protein
MSDQTVCHCSSGNTAKSGSRITEMFRNDRNLSRLFLCVASLLFLLPSTQTAGAPPRQLCDDARADPDARIAACTRVLGQLGGGVNLAEVYNHRGAAKVHKGDPNNLIGAIADFTSALNENPRFAGALKNRGLAYKLKGQFTAAIADFTMALQLDPNSPDLYNLRGATLSDDGQYDGAIADFDKAIALDPKYKNALINRGLALTFTRQLDSAIDDFGKVIGLAPQEPLGYVNRAMARMDKGDFQGAVDDYNQAIRLDRNKPGPYTRRGEAWRLQGNFVQALADHNTSLGLRPNEEAYNNRALTLEDQGKLNQAITDCNEAILLNPEFYLAYATRGRLKRLKGNLSGSLSDLDKAVILNPRSPIALTFRGETLRELGIYDTAITDFNEALKNVSDFVAAYTGRGLTYEKIGGVAQAKADFNKALTFPSVVDAGLARPAQAEARTRLAALEPEPSPPIIIPIPVTTVVPDDIKNALYHRGHALLIGVSDYTRGWPNLPNVKIDLQELKAGLEPYFETVEIEPNPTAAKLRERMRELLLGEWNKPDERLFVYYSGHGFTAFNQSSQIDDGYITGSDTPGKAVAKAVSFFEIDSLNRETSARHVLMVFDSCFSGSLFETKGAPEDPARRDFDGILRMLGQPIRYFITAGRKEEEVAADSTFAKTLLRGLRGEADKYHTGIISADELGSYLYHEVPRISQRSQTPQFASIGSATLSEGQFFFLTGPAAADVTATVPPPGFIHFQK